MFAQGNSSEGIFELQFTTQNLNPFYDMFFQRPEFIASSNVLEGVFGVDYNNADQKDIRGDRCSLVSGTNEICKYTGLNYNERKTLQECDTHWFVYRYADILLLKAEALAELGRGDEAVAMIEKIRSTHGAIDLTAQVVNTANKNEVIDYLLAERSRELAYEGKRWFDVLRNARRNNYARIDLMNNMVLTNAPANQQQSILAKLKDPNSHYLPINEYDMYTNKKLVQNPFYK